MNHYHDLACDDRPGLDNCLRAFGLRVLAGQAHRFDTTTVFGRLVFGIFAARADFERELIRERTLAGLKAARAKGQQEVRAVESSGAARAGRDGNTATPLRGPCSAANLGIKQGELREQGEKVLAS